MCIEIGIRFSLSLSLSSVGVMEYNIFGSFGPKPGHRIGNMMVFRANAYKPWDTVLSLSKSEWGRQIHCIDFIETTFSVDFNKLILN